MLQKESHRQHWKMDLMVLGLWAGWIIWMTSLKLPFWLNLTGMSWVLLYAAWRWSWIQAAILFLLMGWIFGSLSLLPSGLLWLSLMMSFLVVRVAQIRLMIRNAFQFSSSVLVTTFGLELLQFFLLTRISPHARWEWIFLLSMLMSAFLHAVIGFFIYNLFERFMEKR